MHSRLVLTKHDGTMIDFGTTTTGAIQSIEVSESVKEMGDTCTIVIPRNLINLQGKNLLNLLTPGDKAQVYFGYNDDVPLEFTGYLKEIGGTAPVVLKFDDEFYPLRKNEVSKSYKSVTLKQLLNDIAPGYQIQCPDVNLGKTILTKVTSYQALKQLNECYGFYSFIKDGVLHTQFAYDVRGFGDEHTYYLCDEFKNGRRIYRANTRPGSNNLVFEHKDSTNVRVEAVANRADGKKFKYSVGPKLEDTSVHKMSFPVGTSDAQVKQFADKVFSSLNFDGYKGSITGYGIPRTKAGDSLNIIDFDYLERDGKYLIEKVVKKYDENGISRDNTISFKI
ncbi:hypothetical protein BDD43_3390 [Mucilaginibacter gracilis]|uniref:Phage protein D n=2 Tax=Mucilaginibacter gracilis TaxID=423350 RepID=A0A495J480_9SPHI|nr:hypothetical protein BDD43_3390 [Mucilaginibacter gracilis]